SQDGLRVKFTQEEIQLGQVGHAGRLGIHQLQDHPANRRGVGTLPMRYELKFRKFKVLGAIRSFATICRAASAFRKVDERNVDPTARRSALQSGNDHAVSWAMVCNRISSENSHSRRASRSTASLVGATCRRPMRWDRLNSPIRLADSRTRAANRRSRSASTRTASNDLITYSSLRQIRNMSAPARIVAIDACSIGAAASTPPISRSSETTIPR